MLDRQSNAYGRTTTSYASPTAIPVYAGECEPATCGNVTISYPFWLGGGNQTSSPCGYPAFQVWCDRRGGGGGVASLRGSAIHVRGIDYGNSSFLAYHTRVVGGDVCRTDFNMSSSLALTPFTVSPQNRALCFLYNCSGAAPPRGLVSAACPGGEVFAYLGGSYYWDSPPAIAAGRCTYTYFPVLGSEAAAAAGMTAANSSRLLRDGFVLEWDAAGVGDCAACNATGGQCRYDVDAAAFACLCPDGRLHGSNCAAEPGQPPCGPPSFQLICNNTRAYLRRSMFQAYRVVGISLETNSFHVVDENLPLATGCPAPPLNVFFGVGLLGTFAIARTNKKLVFLHNCTEPRRAEPPGFRRVSCPDRPDAFVRLSDGDIGHRAPATATVRPDCNVTVVPTLGPLNGSKDDYLASMRNGFLLEWAVVSEGCPECMASGGECMYGGDNGLGFACNCSGVMQPEKCGQKSKSKTIGIVIMSVAGCLLLPCIYVLIWHRKGGKLCALLFKTTSSSNERNIEALISSHGSLAPKRYKYSEVTKITSSLNNKIGQGGYGVVFKGRLHDGRLVAVKFLHDSKAKGEEFVNEVMSIGRTSHVNIVSLFGFCLEGSKRALIYEYMPNGSLDKYIYSENPKAILGWERLYAIAVGVARGLEYLHHSCNTRIVHFDIKPQNILLDHDFSPKIADFGLAKLCRTKESNLSMTGARGTIGFIAPEVHSRTFGVVSTKSDVYSYGMMLLEMVGGRKNVKSVVEKSSQKYFPDWIYDHFAQDDGLQACEVTQEVEEIAKKMSLIGLWCVQILPKHRPTITKVLEMFERGSDELDMPPKQNFSQILEDSAYNLNVESASSNTPTKTQAYSEALRIKEMSIFDSRTLRRLQTL
ncbi:hypothetical protein ACP4OV_021996 [Aristida adscensionis]